MKARVLGMWCLNLGNMLQMMTKFCWAKKCECERSLDWFIENHYLEQKV
jgi:hypothetical protein